MKYNILVVDDEESIRDTFEFFLSEEGYNVFLACNYTEASEYILNKQVDLIVTDIILGGKTGIEILQFIKEKNLNCPVVMITGYPNLDTASEAVRLGAFDYLAKPVTQDILLKTVKLALEHKNIVDEKDRYRSNLEAIFRSVKDGIITVDKDLNIIEINDSVKSICSLSGSSKGKPFNCAGCNGKICFEALNKTIIEKEAVEVYRLECQSIHKAGQVVSLSITPLIGRNGEFSGAVMVIKDETSLVKLEKTVKKRQSFHNITGKSEKMQHVYSLIEDLAPVSTTVLITGESGTGKELVAEALHYMSPRKDKSLVKVNCSALTETLLESELFGHVKGAFTGALKDKAGRFELAHKGTIFLDEIGDISPSLQLRLLRVLQEKEFERVGDSKTIQVDVRIVTATNKNLHDKVISGEFREDLYYRLNVVEINLPPLRERVEDLPVLSCFFVDKLNKKLNKNIRFISEDVQKLFVEYPWPGNIRELEHTLEHAFILCRRDIITIDDLPAKFKNFLSQKPQIKSSVDDEKTSIMEALKKTGGNKAKAARLLGISRRTIYRKIEGFS
ncbi:MAG: sigma 54-interacting transcriptional regulator [Candidatus Eremiobacterota bacterium]